jgi:hypothetical protein
MGMLLVVQGTTTYPVRYHYDRPPRTGQRRPAPATEAALAAFLGQDLALDPERVQQLMADVHRYGAASMQFELPVAGEGLFVPFQPRGRV